MNTKTVVLNTVEMISQLMGELESKAFEMEGFSDITMNQMLYLETISRLERPTFGDIADHLEVTRPSVSTIVKKLINLDYVYKEQSETDGRVFYLHLTEKGLRFNELHSEVHQILAQRITQRLNQEEIKDLAVLLAKISPE
jgi:DNA-binding MarR family transcriptional regulator